MDGCWWCWWMWLHSFQFYPLQSCEGLLGLTGHHWQLGLSAQSSRRRWSFIALHFFSDLVLVRLPLAHCSSTAICTLHFASIRIYPLLKISLDTVRSHMQYVSLDSCYWKAFLCLWQHESFSKTTASELQDVTALIRRQGGQPLQRPAEATGSGVVRNAGKSRLWTYTLISQTQRSKTHCAKISLRLFPGYMQ